MKGFIRFGLVLALCAGVVSADEVRKRYIAKSPSSNISTSTTEGNGAFVGIEMGFATHTFQMDLQQIQQGKVDFTQSALAVGAKVGYKHFFVKWVGIRGYVDVDYVESRMKMPDSLRQLLKISSGSTNDISYGANADILLNFYNGERVFFGMFAGVGVGYQHAADNFWGNTIASEAGNGQFVVESLKTRKMSGLYADAKVGLRVNAAKYHEVEFIAKIPFVTISKEFSDDGGTTKVPASYKQDYKFMLGYNFVF